MDAIEERLGYSFKNKSLLELALTHKSFSNDSINCYERLEFLGDAVLELIVSKYIFEHFKESEGRLTHIRSAVVCKETLSQLVDKLCIKDFIKMGEYERKNKLFENKSIQADVVEAIFGALFLDSDFDTANEIILRLIKPYVIKAYEGRLFYDYKTRLQEFIQRQKKGNIKYINENLMMDGNKKFKVCLYINDVKIAESIGASKKEAEQKAALSALEILGENIDEI